MQDTCIYRIEVQGRMNELAFNAVSPLEVTVERVDSASTMITIRTDQSGLIGLLRQLHSSGFMLLSICREEWKEDRSNEENQFG